MPISSHWVPIAGSAVFLIATAGLVWWDAAGKTSSPEAVPSLRLHAMEQEGRIRVDWDPAEPALREAKSATLYARDGGDSHEYPVTREALRSGGLDYLRRTNDVLLTLRVQGTGAESAVRTVVSAPRVVEPAPDVTRARRGR